jgi:DNA-binding transcriptional ArsR family regulator
MIRIQFDAASVARVRVAASPVFEVVAWLGVVASGVEHPILGDPGPAARNALRDDDVAATATIISYTTACHYLPDFLTPKPGSAPLGSATLDEQLSAIGHTPADVVESQLPERWWSSPVVAERHLDVDVVPTMAAAGLAKFWRTALADDWPHLEHGLTEQVHRCGLQFASGGVAALFNSLHPSVRWSGNTLMLAEPRDAIVRLSDGELVVIPSLLTPPRLTVQLDGSRDASVVFPARSPRLPHQQAADQTSLLGRGRTSVLSALRTPRTNREVARELRVSASTVSHHLHALSRGGLAERHRRGRGVIYSLTPLGRELIARIEAAD